MFICVKVLANVYRTTSTLVVKNSNEKRLSFAKLYMSNDCINGIATLPKRIRLIELNMEILFYDNVYILQC